MGDRAILTFNAAVPNTSHRSSAAQVMDDLKTHWIVADTSPDLQLQCAAVTRECLVGGWGDVPILLGEVCVLCARNRPVNVFRVTRGPTLRVLRRRPPPPLKGASGQQLVGGWSPPPNRVPPPPPPGVFGVNNGVRHAGLSFEAGQLRHVRSHWSTAGAWVEPVASETQALLWSDADLAPGLPFSTHESAPTFSGAPTRVLPKWSWGFGTWRVWAGVWLAPVAVPLWKRVGSGGYGLPLRVPLMPLSLAVCFVPPSHEV